MTFKSWSELQAQDAREMALLDVKKRSARAMDPSITMEQYLQYFSYGGLQYPFVPSQTLLGNREDIPQSFIGYVQGAYQTNSVVFACVLARLMVASEMRFQWRRLGGDGHGRPADLWGNSQLAVLEHPWPNAATGDLVTRAMQDSDIGGNFYTVCRLMRDMNGRKLPRIKRLRPDWMTIVLGSYEDPGMESEVQAGDLEAEVIGYAYHPGGYRSGRDPIFLGVDEVAHFAPIPDPIASYRGMSWLTPLIREVMGDSAATTHKLKFFENGATVNTVVSLAPDISSEAFDEWIKKFRIQHEGAMNAYRTLYLAGGATVTPIGANFEQMDFKVTQGHGESRIAAAAGVPPIIAGFSEGLESGTYSNYAQARRSFADRTIRPWWRNFCSSLETVVPPPPGNQLWYDERDVAFLREDKKDQSQIQQVEAQTISSLISAGFRPDSVVAAVQAGDFDRLKHTGLYSVQLQPPGLSAPNPSPPLGPGVTVSALPEPAKNGAGNGSKPPATKNPDSKE